MIRRYLQYENFRTLGIKGEVEPENAKLIINETDEDVNQTFGGLVTLIGLNNTGKSNAIIGLKKLKAGIDENDEPDFLFDENHSTNLFWVFQDREKDFKVKYDLNQGKSFVSWDIDTSGLTTKQLGEKDVERINKVQQGFKSLAYDYNERKDEFNNLEVIAEVNIPSKKDSDKVISQNEFLINKGKFEDIQNDLSAMLTKNLLNHSDEYYKKVEKASLQSNQNTYHYYQLDRNQIINLINNMANVHSHIVNSTSKTATTFKEIFKDMKIVLGKIQKSQTQAHYIESKFVDDILQLLPNIEKIRSNHYIQSVKSLLTQIKRNQLHYHTAFLSDLDPNYILETAETSINDYNELVNRMTTIVESIEKTSAIEADDLNELHKIILELKKQVYISSNLKEIIKEADAFIKENKTLNASELKLQKYLSDNKDIKKKFLELPNIIDYNQSSKFKNEDLEIRDIDAKNVLDKIEKSVYFSKVLNLIGIKPKEFKIAYEKSLLHRGALKELRKKVNEGLEKISEQFNRLYFQNKEEKYKFEIDIEEQRILFTIEDNGLYISYDRQSTGFKWFFNFFFTTIAGNGIKAGDIVLLDEPATNLHPQSQIELRRLIKKFALSQNITFVISTHSPFLVDLNHLDELRITRKEERATIIENKFTNFDEIDVSDPIQSALTIERFMMFNPKNNVVFVEGVTDYNYLVAFNKIFKSYDLSFIPMQGLLDLSQDKIKSMAEKHRNPYVLLDSDHAGDKFKELCKKHENISIFSIDEVDEKFQTIEDLFAANDKKKYRISADKEDKLFYRSTNFKNKIKEDNLEKTTLNNFKKLLGQLDLA